MSDKLENLTVKELEQDLVRSVTSLMDKVEDWQIYTNKTLIHKSIYLSVRISPEEKNTSISILTKDNSLTINLFGTLNGNIIEDKWKELRKRLDKNYEKAILCEAVKFLRAMIK